MLKERKYELVDELAGMLEEASTLIVADYRGLSVADLEKLRAELYNHGTRFRIVKNTLTLRAAEKAGIEELNEFLTGPTAIAFVTDGDMVAAAKTLVATAKETEVLSFKGGILEGRKIDGGDVDALAKLPPIDALQGLVVGVVAAPLTHLVSLLNAPLRDIVGVLDARVRQLEEQGESVVEHEPDAAAEPEADAAEPESGAAAEPEAEPQASAEQEDESGGEAQAEEPEAAASDETTDANESKEDENDGDN